jgi:hypothetical protein
MTRTFWKYSDIVKPKDREFVCHATAYDFSNPFDFRLTYDQSNNLSLN